VSVKTNKTERPIKILQFGEGNFLRAFVDYMVDVANERACFNGNVQIVKPVSFGSIETLKAQNCVYTALLRGKEDGEIYTEKRTITCISDAIGVHEDYDEYAAFAKSDDLRFIVSNTTEAGIVYDETDKFELCPPKSYPAKLTKFLYERFKAFDGSFDKGLIILPVELIDKNGQALKECCLKLSELWHLSEEFKIWLVSANTFCNTLVDRIVTGYPKDEADVLEKELGWCDDLVVAGEPFALWVIETDNPSVAGEFSLDRAGLPVIFTDDLTPYRERKVRLLNGAHTTSALVAYLSNLDTVGDMMKDKTMGTFLKKALYEELVPMVQLPADEVIAFADAVIERFENPFIKHYLLSISLNSISKFKVRVLPTILETYEKTGRLPKLLCFSFAALIAFYTDGMRDGKPYEVSDDLHVLEFFDKNKLMKPKELIHNFLSNAEFWGEDLTNIPELSDRVTDGLYSIRANGMREAVERIIL